MTSTTPCRLNLAPAYLAIRVDLGSYSNLPYDTDQRSAIRWAATLALSPSISLWDSPVVFFVVAVPAFFAIAFPDAMLGVSWPFLRVYCD
jgi:hypothetical protein